MSTSTTETENQQPGAPSSSDIDELPAPAANPTPGPRGPRTTRPSSGIIRGDALRIILPRDEAKLEALPDDVTGRLVLIIEEVTDEAGVKSVEILMFNGRYGLEIILHPTPGTVDKRGMQTTLSAFRRQLHSPVINQLVDAAKEHLPDCVGIEIGDLNLDPLGTTDVTTTRLLRRKNQQITQSGKYAGSPLERIFETYQAAAVPFLYQVILEKDRNKNQYQMAIRMAIYHPDYNYTGDKGFAKLLENGHPLDISRPFAPYKFVSNHSALGTEYWTTTYTERVDGGVEYSANYDYRKASRYKTKYEVRKTADKLKRLVLGKVEHEDLRLGNASWDPVYKDQDHYARFDLNPGQLEPFIELVPIQFRTNPWLAINGRSQPEFNTREIVRQVNETVHGLGEGTLYTPDSHSDLANEGKAGHQSLGTFIQTWFNEHGDEIKEVKQTSESVPDYVLKATDGRIVAFDEPVDCAEVAVEAESKTPSKASKTLVNVERAIAHDQHVILVYPNNKLAGRGYDHVTQPYKGDTEHGIHLYNRDKSVTDSDGRVVVCEGSTRAEWYLDGQTLTGRIGDTEIVAGDASDDVGTFDYGTSDTDDGDDADGDDTETDGPRIRYLVEHDDDDAYRIETADGEVIEERTSDDALVRNWTRLKTPHIPLDVSYLANVTILYHDRETNELKHYTEDPEFDTEPLDVDFDGQAGKRDWYKAGAYTYCDRYLVEQDRGEIPYREFLDRVGTWFGARSTLGKPHNSEVGRALPGEIKDAQKGGTNNRNPYIDGYAWRFELGIDSPYRPEPKEYELIDSDDDEDVTE